MILDNDLCRLDCFCSMPHSSQMLYIRLVENADNNGIVTNTRSAMEIARATSIDMLLLMAKCFVEGADDGIRVARTREEWEWLKRGK